MFIAPLAYFIVSIQAWNNSLEQYPVMIAAILAAVDLEFPVEQWQLDRIDRLGVLQDRSIPLYHHHLRIQKNFGDTSRILGIVQAIPGARRSFLPYATQALLDDAQCAAALKFIYDFGTPTEAKQVSQLLISQKIEVFRVQGYLQCLAKIGGKDELDVLSTFIVKSIGENPKMIWQQEVDDCRKAIKERIEAEAKCLKAKPVR